MKTGEGSTRVTILAQTIQALDEGEHTAVAAFRRDDGSGELEYYHVWNGEGLREGETKPESELAVVAQRFTVQLTDRPKPGGNENEGDGGNGPAEGGQNPGESTNPDGSGTGGDDGPTGGDLNPEETPNSGDDPNSGATPNPDASTNPSGNDGNETGGENAGNDAGGPGSEGNATGEAANTGNDARNAAGSAGGYTAADGDAGRSAAGSATADAAETAVAETAADGEADRAAGTATTGVFTASGAEIAVSGLAVDANGRFYFALDGSDAPLELRIDIPFAEYESLAFDDAPWSAEDDYAVRSGSTVLTIAAERLERCAAGVHTLSARFRSETVEIVFALIKSAAPLETSSAQADLAAGGNENGASRALVWIFIALGLVALAATTLIIRSRKNKT
jgi:hypothetical protein